MHILKQTLLIGLILLLPLLGVQAQEDTSPTLVPIGGGYTDTYPGFIAEALKNVKEDYLYILIIPAAYTTNAEAISADELILNTKDADRRRDQLQAACEEGVPEGVECNVDVIPMYTREMAEAPTALEYINEDLAAVYFLGGDQQTAMQAIANTPLEDALAEAFARGVVIGGNSAGLAIQARNMIGGFNEGFDENTALNEGAIDFWIEDDRRGLDFGVTNVLLDQHLFQYSRPARAIAALAAPDLPDVVVGVDGYTGAILRDNQVGDVFGLYTAAVFDGETLGAAEAASYNDGILSIRNVLVHVLAPGGSSYNLETLESSVAAVPESFSHSYDALSLPEGAGTLVLSGGSLINSPEDNAVIAYFLDEVVAIDNSSIVIITFEGEAGDELSVIVNGEAVDADDLENALAAADGIIVAGPNQANIDVEALAPVRDAWEQGVPVLADDAAAAVMGAFYSAHGPTPEATDEEPYAEEDATQGSFKDGMTTVSEGLGLLNITVEPRIISDTRWGRLFSLAYANPELPAFGLTDDSALVISADGAMVMGSNGVIALDLSNATLELGENDAFVIANGLIDVFAPGETVEAAAME